MSQTHFETVYALLSAALWGGSLTAEAGTDWQAVTEELRHHAVDGLVMDALPSVNGPDKVLKQEWLRRSTRSMAFWHRLMKEQQALDTLLREADIPYVILKGAAAAIYYPQPEYRAMGDVDLIVSPEDFSRAETLMVENGYTPAAHANRRHTEFSKNGVDFELHRYFSQMDDPAGAEAFDRAIRAGIGSAQRAELGKFSFPVLEPLENGLILLGHIDQHMEEGLGLRQIIDWMLYADRVLDDRFWETSFEPWASRLGLKTLAVTVTRMCQLYLGLRQDIRWCAAAEEDLCRELMALIMSRGNFGRKQTENRTAVSVATIASRVTNIPGLLQSRGLRNWKAAGKWPILRPFAWLYQLCRYIKQALTREHPIRQLLADLRTGSKQDDLLTRLGIARRAHK